MKTHLKMGFMLCLTASCFWFAETGFASDKEPYADQYEVLKKPPSNRPSDKVELVEFFWYTCPHCYSFERYLEPWLKTKSDDVEFRQVPAIFGELPEGRIPDTADYGRMPLAKAYYAAQALEVLDKVHTPIFEAIHDDHRRLDNQSKLRRLFVKNGVNKRHFDSAYKSFWVDSQIRNAKAMTQEYGLSGVPVLFINGKEKRYRLTSEKADGYVNMMMILNYLIEKEQQLMTAKQPATANDTPATTPEPAPTEAEPTNNTPATAPEPAPTEAEPANNAPATAPEPALTEADKANSTP